MFNQIAGNHGSTKLTHEIKHIFQGQFLTLYIFCLKWEAEWHERKASQVQFPSVQSFGCVQLFGTPWTAAHQASLSILSSCSLLKLMSVELVMPSSPAFSLSQH